MTLRVYSVTFDAIDPQALGRFYADALGWQVVFDSPDEVAVAQDESTWPGLVFCRVDEAKVVKNRVHLDLNPQDRDAEVARLEALGARQVDIGQGEQSWVVMADPEGNELCVLRPHPEQT
jgi:predicted enzyme related to lactoylglutathione lyase